MYNIYYKNESKDRRLLHDTMVGFGNFEMELLSQCRSGRRYEEYVADRGDNSYSQRLMIALIPACSVLFILVVMVTGYVLCRRWRLVHPRHTSARGVTNDNEPRSRTRDACDRSVFASDN